MKTRQFQLASLILVLGLTIAPGLVFAANDGHGSHGGHGGHGEVSSPSPAAEKSGLYTTSGVVQSVDQAAGKAVITHEPVPALNWPTMTMGFTFEDASLLEGLKAGDKVRLDFYNQGNASVIVDIEARE